MNFESILTKVTDLSIEVGNFIAEQRISFQSSSIEQKGLNDLVSYVDKESERKIVEGLKLILPSAGFITEEGSENEKSVYNWIVDPLDGTTNFVHGIPCYCVSIALETNNVIQLGIVHEVCRSETFSAIRGKGAFLNGTKIKTSNAHGLGQSLIATGFPINNFSRQDEYLHFLKMLMQKTRGIRRIGSAAADLCYLACGRVDAFFEYNLNSWDVAAGSLIAEEAGAIVTDFKDGKDYIFGREIVACSPLLHKVFLSDLQKSFNKA